MHMDDFDEPQGHSALGFPEFIVLVAAIMSTQALAVDAMLPALPRIVHELHLPNPYHGQWVVTTYVAGIGLGQLFWGVASDRFGRRPILLIGFALYVIAAALCGMAESFRALLLWRSVQKLQKALHAKAKAEPGYRFYALYDKIYREDNLAYAYAQRRANAGAPGVDGQDFPQVEAYGVGRWLGEQELSNPPTLSSSVSVSASLPRALRFEMEYAMGLVLRKVQ